ncbi:MAG TPA: NADH-quinone oxidoreductase subunit L [Candidatus Acidoferrum sp.]|nr:NADH-quinone oxidoreductase subunit L [Candidatus Acidoferrum sp.]
MNFSYPEDLAWVVLLLPLLAAVVIALFTQRWKFLSAQISIIAVIGSFVASAVLLAQFLLMPNTEFMHAQPFQWLAAGIPGLDELKVSIGLNIDRLSLIMLLVVTGVGGLIHIYSYGYMHEDPGFSRFFACLSLFTFSMLGIVLANNFVMMFIFWELVGVSSYLLIGFWYEKASAGDAAKKAFITNRLGDFGFLLGIILIWHLTSGLIEFDALKGKFSRPDALGQWVNVAGLLIFCGAMGKSAQFPLHVWLPDAMEGPTPVSALIHAATMVAAGVYMLCRVFFIFSANTGWPEALSFMNGWTALDIIAWIGGFTALLAALIAVQQNDIKRILAYSTLSQLGYMVMSVGLAGPTPAMFHLATHAFFKALLFLGAGSVIHAMHHEQDIWVMGDLRKKLPTTWWTFLAGTLALAGIWPLAGFYSKDSILAQALQAGMEQHKVSGYLLFALAVFVAFLTAFYMFRLLFVVFFGSAKSDPAQHVQESPGVMTWPLRILAVLSIMGGIIGIDAFVSHMFVTGEAHHGPWFDSVLQPFGHNALAAMFGLLAAIAGISLAAACYWNATKDSLPARLGWLSRAMRNRFYFDELYSALIAVTHEALSKLADWFDRWIIAGLGVRGTHGTTEIFGRALRLVQTGNLQTYAFLFAFGLAVILFFVLK